MDTLDKNHATASIRKSWVAETASGDTALVLDLVPAGTIGLVVNEQAIQLLRETLDQAEESLQKHSS